jgi:hypothetical protein
LFGRKDKAFGTPKDKKIAPNGESLDTDPERRGCTEPQEKVQK